MAFNNKIGIWSFVLDFHFEFRVVRMLGTNRGLFLSSSSPLITLCNGLSFLNLNSYKEVMTPLRPPPPNSMANLIRKSVSRKYRNEKYACCMEWGRGGGEFEAWKKSGPAIIGHTILKQWMGLFGCQIKKMLEMKEVSLLMII